MGKVKSRKKPRESKLKAEKERESICLPPVFSRAATAKLNDGTLTFKWKRIQLDKNWEGQGWNSDQLKRRLNGGEHKLELSQ